MTKRENKTIEMYVQKSKEQRRLVLYWGVQCSGRVVCKGQSWAPWTPGRRPPAGLPRARQALPVPCPFPQEASRAPPWHCPAANATAPAPGATGTHRKGYLNASAESAGPSTEPARCPHVTWGEGTSKRPPRRAKGGARSAQERVSRDFTSGLSIKAGALVPKPPGGLCVARPAGAQGPEGHRGLCRCPGARHGRRVSVCSRGSERRETRLRALSVRTEVKARGLKGATFDSAENSHLK